MWFLGGMYIFGIFMFVLCLGVNMSLERGNPEAVMLIVFNMLWIIPLIIGIIHIVYTILMFVYNLIF